MNDEQTKNKIEVIIVHENLFQCVLSDISSLSLLLVAVYLGVLLESEALQWIAGVLWLCMMFSKAVRSGNRKTPQEAADFLNERFGVKGNDR